MVVAKFLLLPLIAVTLIGHNRAQTLKTTAGEWILLPCLLPEEPRPITWFYWQVDNSTLYDWKNETGLINVHPPDYKGRIEISSNNINAGNISLRLYVTVEDNGKTFYSCFNLRDQPDTLEHCKVTLQVSAPYRDLQLTVDVEMNAVCTAHGGFPLSNMTWKGQEKNTSAQRDLEVESRWEESQNKTFTVTSSVSALGFESITCSIYNHHSLETKNVTWRNDTGNQSELTDEGRNRNLLYLLLIIPAVGIYVLVYCYYKNRGSSGGGGGGGGGGEGEGGEGAEMLPLAQKALGGSPQSS